jgi:hypothetical protein
VSTSPPRIEIPIGSTFEQTWPLTDADTGAAGDPTGWNARCEVRDTYGGNLLTRFHSDVAKGWDGSITMTDPTAGGNLTISLPAAKTALLAPSNSAVFDLEVIDPSGAPYRILSGRAFITPEVTTDG